MNRAAQGRAAQAVAARAVEPTAPAEPEPSPWTEMPDVIAAVEDLADAGEKPWQISRLLGLRRDEVFTIPAAYRPLTPTLSPRPRGANLKGK